MHCLDGGACWWDANPVPLATSGLFGLATNVRRQSLVAKQIVLLVYFFKRVDGVF